MDESIRSREQLFEFISNKKKLVILTGAGLSAGSGIPTYRDSEGNWLRSEPIQHQDFISKHSARQRYWLRSFAGWPAVAEAIPSIGHKVLTELEHRGHVELIVTQNIDRLHQKAGSRRVIDLHGRLDEVVCLSCKAICSRASIQQEISAQNSLLTETGQLAPDGDADVEEQFMASVVPPRCHQCQGILKPNVVFFGDNVPAIVVQQVYDAISECDGLLIIGTSLKVFSGYRFCRHASEIGIPIASINPGRSRGDELIALQVRAPADDVLGQLRLQLREGFQYTPQHVIEGGKPKAQQ
jgi:NAD-dependent SIR2 family protein deacetylase